MTLRSVIVPVKPQNMNSNNTASSQSYPREGSATDLGEKERRASIQAIMKDPSLTPHERRKSIQYLMDGRRRSSMVQPSFLTPLGNDMAMAAATDASSDDEAFTDSAARQKMIYSKLLKSKRVSSTCDAADGFSEMDMKRMGADIDVCHSVPSEKSIARSRMMEKSRPTCPHYQRNCSIVSPCCGLVFGCRICHDDYPELPPPLSRQQSDADKLETLVAVEDSAPLKPPALSQRRSSLPMNFEEDEEPHHEINRFLIKEVICRECFTLQSSKT